MNQPAFVMKAQHIFCKTETGFLNISLSRLITGLDIAGEHQIPGCALVNVP
jgi:hypothetical protein